MFSAQVAETDRPSADDDVDPWLLASARSNNNQKNKNRGRRAFRSAT